MDDHLADEFIGTRHGRLTAVKPTAGRKYKCVVWEWRCECGGTIERLPNVVRRMVSPSCGCWTYENRKRRMTSHGKYGTYVYRAWIGMKARCNKPNKHYADRGITVYAPWSESFMEFYSYMGDPPEGRSLDRIDNNGNYEPGNVRWADRNTQQNNRRNNRYITYKGKTHTLAEWAWLAGITDNCLHLRLRKGWDVGRALNV